MSDLQRILRNLLEYFNRDKVKLVRFCLERQHPQNEIADALGITESTLSKFIKKYKVKG